jgi:hypothetical protein
VAGEGVGLGFEGEHVLFGEGGAGGDGFRPKAFAARTAAERVLDRGRAPQKQLRPRSESLGDGDLQAREAG